MESPKYYPETTVPANINLLSKKQFESPAAATCSDFLVLFSFDGDRYKKIFFIRDFLINKLSCSFGYAATSTQEVLYIHCRNNIGIAIAEYPTICEVTGKFSVWMFQAENDAII